MEIVTIKMTLEENQVVAGILEDWLHDDNRNPHELTLVRSAFDKIRSA